MNCTYILYLVSMATFLRHVFRDYPGPVLLAEGYGLGAGPTGLVVACLSIGAVMGALGGGRSADRFGWLSDAYGLP